MCLSVFLLRFILPGTLHFLDLVDYILSHVSEVFSYYLFKYFLWPFSLSLLLGSPIMQILMYLMLSQRSLQLFFFIPPPPPQILFCRSDFHHSVLQVIYSFFCLSYSPIDSFHCIVQLCWFVLQFFGKHFFASSHYISEILDHLHDYSESWIIWKVVYLHFI